MNRPLNWQAAPQYSSLVRRCFADPRHAGELPGAEEPSFSATCSESERGATVQLDAWVRDGKFAALRFRVFGCPYLIAAAEITCADFEGRSCNQLQEFAVEELASRLDAPVEKTGRLLLLEDTISCLRELMDKNLDGDLADTKRR